MKRIMKVAKNTEKQLFVLRCWVFSGDICGHGQKGESGLLCTEFGLLATDFHSDISRNSPGGVWNLE